MPDPGDDPFLWLEDIDGERALAWVRERNAHSASELTAWPGFASTRDALREVLDASDRIPTVTRRGRWLYNLWQDERHRRGLWRRTTLAEYRQPQPQWETVLDIDALAAAENENWVWGGATCLAPDYRLCLIALSRGGADATVVREFDALDKTFVAGGFSLPEAKSDVCWIDADAIHVGTDFGAGSLTDSGYPRVVRRWQRGTPLAAASIVFEAEPQDVSASVMVDDTPGFERTLLIRSIDFHHRRHFLLQPEPAQPRLLALDVPDDAQIGYLRDTLLVFLRSELRCGDACHAAGSLLAIDAAAHARGGRDFQLLFAPTATRSLESYATTRDHLIAVVSDQVASTLALWRKTPAGFEPRPIVAPSPGSLGVQALHDPHCADDPLADAYLLSYTDFLTPDSLLLGDAGAAPQAPRELLKSRSALFDAAGMRVEQRFATSADGTRVPYFVVLPRAAVAAGESAAAAPGSAREAAAATGRSAAADGLPTLLYGYGGFEISLQPWYAATFGRAWLSRGGALVVANIRGGGEFGPGWHKAAIKAGKQRSYDDFIAVAEDLVGSGLTSPRRLGSIGGSNGGLLVGACMVQRPDLFGAVVCQVPLLDMRRFNVLLAGASWMAEYGNPDRPEDWDWISRYSPYHNVVADVRYPRPLLTTSTRDDRVHPAHARKMAARMLAQGHPVLYYENVEGGHGGAADNEQRAHLLALEFSYLWQQIG